jgi:hypothetical protein
MSWIKINSKEKPKDLDKVLIGMNDMSIDGKLQPPLVFEGWFCDGKFYSTSTREEVKSITHWQLLPILKNGD